MPNSPDPLFTEDEAQSPPMEPPVDVDGEYQVSAHTTIKELRLLFGPHFAPGYGDQDLMGELLGRGGYASLDEYLNRHHLSDLQTGN